MGNLGYMRRGMGGKDSSGTEIGDLHKESRAGEADRYRSIRVDGVTILTKSNVTRQLEPFDIDLKG